MKKIISYTLCVIFVLILNYADAKIRRVGYPGTLIPKQDYTSLQTAHDSANTGDTLLIFPGSWNANFGKRLVVIGYGYFLSGTGADSGFQVIKGDMTITIGFFSNSDGTVLEGLNGLGATIRADVKGVVITSCNCNIGGFGNTFINWKISKSVVAVYANYNPTFQNVLFENDIFVAADFWGGTNPPSGTFNNNIFLTAPNFRNGSYTLYNNIFLSTTVGSNYNNCYFDYNIIGANINLPGGTHNKTNVDLSTVFVTQG